MSEQRWGGKTRLDDVDSGKEIILTAAKACFAKNGVSGTSIEDIAKEVKITRRSIYRYFENKGAIIQALVEEQAAIFLAEMNTHLENYKDNFPELLKQYIMYAVKNGPNSPGHQVYLGSKNFNGTGQYYFSSKANYATFSKVIKPAFKAAQENAQINKDLQYMDLMMWAARIVFSLIQLPESDEDMAKHLERYLWPSLKP